MLPDPGIFALENRPMLSELPRRPAFGAIVADALDGVRGLQDSAGESARALMGATGDQVADAYDAILGRAPDLLDAERASLATSPAAALTDAGGRVDYRAGQVRPYLPQPDLGVQMNLIDPPAAPAPGSQGPAGLGGGSTEAPGQGRAQQ